MKLRGAHLGLALNHKSAPGVERERIDVIGEDYAFARAQRNRFDPAQVNDFGKGRAEPGIGAEAGRVIDECAESEYPLDPH